MLTLRDPMPQVRAACTRNNFAWLRASGCRIDARGPWWSVWHDELPEYRALLVLREAAPASARDVEDAVADAARNGLAVYVDAGASTDWARALCARGYATTLHSSVRVAAVGSSPATTSSLRMRRLGTLEADAWTALYMRVFDRPASLAAAERRRWQRALGEVRLQHYLYEHDGVAAGLCELCVDDAVAGLYSVGFVPAERRPRLLRLAVQMARDVVRAQGLRLMYFERVRKPPLKPDAAQAVRRVVRHFDAWTLG